MRDGLPFFTGNTSLGLRQRGSCPSLVVNLVIIPIFGVKEFCAHFLRAITLEFECEGFYILSKFSVGFVRNVCGNVKDKVSGICKYQKLNVFWLLLLENLIPSNVM